MVSVTGDRYRFTFVGGGRVSTIGGIVRTIAEIANDLCDAGHKVRVIANGRPGDKPYYDYRKDVDVVVAAYPYSAEKFGTFRKVLSRPLAGAPSDVIIVMSSNRLVENLLEAADGLPAVIVRSEHGDPQSLLHTVWEGDKAARRATFERADRSHLLFPEYARTPDLGDRVRARQFHIPAPVQIPAGIADCGKPALDGRYRLVSVGRMEEFEKNSGLLLDAFAEIAKDHPDWDLHFYGDGGLREELEARSVGEGLASRVVFHGSLGADELSDEMLKGSLFAIPSDSEGCPMALGEALAHGLPAVGFSDCAGVSRTIRHGVNGLLAFTGTGGERSGGPKMTIAGGLQEGQARFEQYQAEPFNQVPDFETKRERVSAFCECLATLMANHGLRAQMGKLARNTVWDREQGMVLRAWRDHLIGFAANRETIVGERHASVTVPIERQAQADGFFKKAGRVFSLSR